MKLLRLVFAVNSQVYKIHHEPGRRVSRRGLNGIVGLETPPTENGQPGVPPGSPLGSRPVRTVVRQDVPQLGNKVPLRSWFLLAGLALTEFCTFASITVLSPFFPSEAEKKGTSSSAYGGIIGSFELAALLVSIMCIKLVLHVKPKMVLIAGVLLLTIGTFCFSLVTMISTGTMFIAVSTCLRLLQGTGAGMIDVCSYMVVSYLIPSRVSLAIGVLEMAVGLGITAGPALGGFLYEMDGFFLPFVVLGVITFLNVPGNYLLFPETERKSSSSEIALWKFLKNADVLLGILSITTGGMTLGFLTSILEPRLRQYKLSVSEVGLVTVLPGAVFAVLTPFWGHLADHVKEYNLYLLLILANVLNCAGYVFLGPIPGIHCDPSLWLMLVSLFVCGLGAAAQSISPFALMVKSTRRKALFEDLVAAALVSAVHITCSTAGTSLGPIIGGLFMDSLGFDWFCLFMAILGLAQITFFAAVWFVKFRTRTEEK